MSPFFSRFRRNPSHNYDLRKLVDQRFLEGGTSDSGSRHVICDIDKTYLETEFESLVKMARIPFEGAKDKVTVRGAAEVLQAYRWGDPATGADPLRIFPQQLHFVSSSPPQLRNVLEQKLALDGLDWSSDTFKNQAYNLKKGRFDQLRQQAAYKSIAIFSILHQMKPGAKVLFIGDNAESDAFVYLGIKLLVEDKLSRLAYQEYIELSGVEEQMSKTLVEVIDRKVDCTITGILIRDLPGSTFCLYDPLTRPVRLFSDFFEVAVFMIGLGYIEQSALWGLIRSFHNRHGISLERAVSVISQAQKYFAASSAFVALSDAVLSRLFNSTETAKVSAIKAKPSHCFEEHMEMENIGDKYLLEHCKIWLKRLQEDKNS